LIAQPSGADRAGRTTGPTPPSRQALDGGFALADFSRGRRKALRAIQCDSGRKQRPAMAREGVRAAANHDLLHDRGLLRSRRRDRAAIVSARRGSWLHPSVRVGGRVKSRIVPRRLGQDTESASYLIFPQRLRRSRPAVRAPQQRRAAKAGWNVSALQARATRSPPGVVGIMPELGTGDSSWTCLSRPSTLSSFRFVNEIAPTFQPLLDREGQL